MERSPNEIGVAVQSALPEVVTYDRLQRRSGALVGPLERAANERRHTENPEEVGGYPRPVNELRPLALEKRKSTCEWILHAVCANGFKRAAPIAERKHVSLGQCLNAAGKSRLRVIQAHQALRILERKGSQQHRIDH